MVVKESDIPLEVLFNEEINKIKNEDRRREHNVRPLVFTYQYDENGQKVGVNLEILQENIHKQSAQVDIVQQSEGLLNKVLNNSPTKVWGRPRKSNSQTSTEGMTTSKD